MSVVLPIPPTGTPYLDPITGAVSLAWQNYFLSLNNAVATGFAPADGRYWVATSNSELSDEINLGALTNGYVKLTVAVGVGLPSIVTSIPVADLTGILALTHGGTGISASPTDGQLLIGKTSDHSLNLATLSAGSGISIGNGAGAITIAAAPISLDWTPVIGGSGGAPTGQAYSIQVGKSLKIGKLVWFSAYCVFSAKGTIAGSIQLQGLPYATVNAANALSGLHVEWFTLNTNWNYISCELGVNATVGTLYGTTAAAASLTALVTGDLTNASQFIISGSYMADA